MKLGVSFHFGHVDLSLGAMDSYLQTGVSHVDLDPARCGSYVALRLHLAVSCGPPSPPVYPALMFRRVPARAGGVRAQRAWSVWSWVTRRPLHGQDLARVAFALQECWQTTHPSRDKVTFFSLKVLPMEFLLQSHRQGWRLNARSSLDTFAEAFSRSCHGQPH